MPNLIDETPAAFAWVERLFRTLPESTNLGKLVSAVLWTDGYLHDGEPIGGNDPSALVDEINNLGFPILRGHDPGLPAGRILAAQVFTSPSGSRFVAAILTIYEPDHQLAFAALGVDPVPSVTSPTTLGPLDGAWIDFGTDPREVDSHWLEEVLEGAPLSVKRIDLSNNAAESVKELIRIGLPIAVLIWNPLVTTVANEAAKDIYAGIRDWLRKLWQKLKERHDPIVVVQTHYGGCSVSFLFRGRDVDQHYVAHDALPIAVAQAVKLIDSLERHNVEPISLTYEFEQSRWFPSYAVLTDGRIVSDRSVLIAFEQLPKGLSLGILRRQVNDR
jgi:hypothetical protein